MIRSVPLAAVLTLIAVPGSAQVGLPSFVSPGPPIAAMCPPRVGGAPTPGYGGTSGGDVASGPIVLVNRWTSAGQTSFTHVIEGPVGPVRLTLETCSTATGGETVAVYPATLAGYRMPRRPRVMFSIAVPRGNVRMATLVIPPARRGARTGAVRLAVVVENASGRPHSGAYRLTVTP